MAAGRSGLIEKLDYSGPCGSQITALMIGAQGNAG
jgi:hypothetical protein